MIEPISSSAKLRLHTKPEKDDFKLPKILLNVVFEEIAIALTRAQVNYSSYISIVVVVAEVVVKVAVAMSIETLFLTKQSLVSRQFFRPSLLQSLCVYCLS